MYPHYPRPKLLDAIPLDAHAVIEASAGTGKTFAIENMVVELLLRDKATLDQMLVLTFTERAAAELRQRIRAKLEEIRFNPCQIGSCSHEVPQHVWQINESVRRLLDQALLSFDAASIGTIHGFFGRVLAEHAFDSGHLFDSKLVDGRTLFSHAFKTALRTSFARPPGEPAQLLSSWLEQKDDGVEKLEELLYKCQIVRSRILPAFSAAEIQREIDASELFNLVLPNHPETFIAALKKAGGKTPTLKAINNRLDTLAAKIKSLGRSWQVVLDREFQKALAEALDSIRTKIPALPSDAASANALVQAMATLESHLVSLEAAIVQTGLHELRPILESQKIATGQHDYDDLVSGVKQALDGPRGAELICSMRNRYSHALIDEFQDTDELQWDFFRRVFLESNNRNLLYLVGDPKQAIYGFRGADVATYLKARTRLSQSNQSKLVPLDKNFRSASSLIAAYNHIFDQSAQPPFFRGQEIRYDQPVAAGRELIVELPDGSPHVPIHLLKVKTPDGGGGISTLRRNLARLIAREVRLLLSDGSRLKFGTKDELKPLEAREIFILTAKNSEAIEVSQALREARVPFAFYKQDGLFQTDQAHHVRDLLRAVDAPDDRLLRTRAWLTPFFAVPLEALPGLADVEVTHPLVRPLVQWNDLAKDRRFESLFSQIQSGSGIIRRELFLEDNERALTNYLHIFEILLEEARTTGCDLARLVSTLSAYISESSTPPSEDGNVQRLETDRDAVQIMTIHKSKGLEAAIVFVYGGLTGFGTSDFSQYHDEQGERILFIGNSARAKDDANREREEELERLYYVALTRAKARLYLPFVEQQHWHPRWDGGYRRVNDRLNQIVETMPGSATEPLFQIVSVPEQPPAIDSPEHDISPILSQWKPPTKLLEESSDESTFDNMRRRHAGFVVTSYSRLKSTFATELVPLGRDELEPEIERSAAVAILPEDELPGGTPTGLMLHKILELIPFESLKGPPPFDDWIKLPKISNVIDDALALNTIKKKFREKAANLAYRALTMEIPIGNGKSIPGIHQSRNYLREMEFLFPYPEDSSRNPKDQDPKKLLIERGFIKGYVDLVLEHDNLVYLADWKSDMLLSYDQASIDRHVADHYDLQAKLYSLALVKALSINKKASYEERFGGMFYVFLRSLGQADGQPPGVYFHRPSWSEIRSYEQELKRADRLPRNAHS